MEPETTDQTKLFQTEQALHHEADSFILETGIFDALRPFGELVIEGSYVYHTMVERDIDIRIISTTKQPDTALRNEITQAVLNIDGLTKLRLVDLTKQQQTEAPSDPGIWIAPQISFNGNIWNVDIWLYDNLNGRKQLDIHNHLLTLSDNDRSAILAIKQYCLAHGLKKKDVTSIDIYQAVLGEGIRSPQEYVVARDLA